MSRFEIVSKYNAEGLSLPTRGTGHAAGYDFCVAQDITIPSIYDIPQKVLDKNAIMPQTLTLNEASALYKEYKYKPILVPTGIKCKLDPGQYLELSVRSSTPLKYWLILANGVGIIDGDYYNNPDNEGEIFFQLINLGPFGIKLKKGDKIGQGIIKSYQVVDDDKYGKGTIRVGGFGSTGINKQDNIVRYSGVGTMDIPQYKANIYCETQLENPSNIDGWGWIGHPVSLEKPNYESQITYTNTPDSEYYIYNKETGQLEEILNEDPVS